MKFLLRNLNAKSVIVLLLIAGVLLLCPANSTKSVSDSSNLNTVAMTEHNDGMGANTNRAESHPQFDSHVSTPSTPFDYLALLFLVIFSLVIVNSYRLLHSTIDSFIVKLNYHQHQYRVIIKPKLETTLLRWLNLLGGTIAFRT